MKIKNIISLCVFSAGHLFAYAQSTGYVFDENKQPIPFANVVLMQLPDSTFIQGTVTDEKGYFSINQVNPQKSLLQVPCMGYGTLYCTKI